MKLTNRYKRQAYLNAIIRACDRAFPLPAALARKKGEAQKKSKARLTKVQNEEVKKCTHPAKDGR
ncbi:hypothetical protein [Frigoriglobus tundricola]|uniref:Uncharacterized protein n=1 Tax=Frigoriglobus tundricola TaxID=2774151 RepID=A0A6M5Z2W7_9BACT|nr:hypothetical protein [Frigoriglobus tundricola]QJX00055.1 hypothetical protein FTUN_7678 [Frigoriglobus tundricola]